MDMLDIRAEEMPTTAQYIRSSLSWFKMVIVEGFKIVMYPFLAILQGFWPRSIDRTVKDYAREYYWHPGGKPTKGVLLIHGFTTSPIIFRQYAKLFLEEGYIAYGVRIAGHGTSPADLASTTAVDWYLSIREKYQELKSKVDDVIILSHSLGGLIGLTIASLFPVHSMILLSVPIIIKPTPLYRANFLLRPLSNVVKYWPNPKERLRQIEALGFKAYEKFPLRAVAGLFDMAIVARDRLPHVKCPVLAMIGDKDEHIDVETLEFMEERIGGSYQKWIARDGTHTIIDSPDEPIMKENIRKFVLKHSPL